MTEVTSVSDTLYVGILVGAAEATVSGSILRDVEADPNIGFGDGIVVQAFEDVVTGSLHLAQLQISDSTISDVDRAGLASFATDESVQRSLFDCNPIDLNFEKLDKGPFEITDDGDNWCGCGEIADGCKVLSTNLEPPPALTE